VIYVSYLLLGQIIPPHNDPYTIMKVGRWKDLKTMLKYCYTIKKRKQKAAKKLGETLGKGTAKVLPLWQFSGKNSS
jgi:hypothetical protein